MLQTQEGARRFMRERVHSMSRQNGRRLPSSSEAKFYEFTVTFCDRLLARTAAGQEEQQHPLFRALSCNVKVALAGR